MSLFTQGSRHWARLFRACGAGVSRGGRSSWLPIAVGRNCLTSVFCSKRYLPTLCGPSGIDKSQHCGGPQRMGHPRSRFWSSFAPLRISPAGSRSAHARRTAQPRPHGKSVEDSNGNEEFGLRNGGGMGAGGVFEVYAA